MTSRRLIAPHLNKMYIALAPKSDDEEPEVNINWIGILIDFQLGDDSHPRFAGGPGMSSDNAHLRGQTFYQCGVCNRKILQKSHMLRHVRTVHEENKDELREQALGTLVGSLYRRYPLELNGMLDYVLNQLKLCKSYDMLLLRKIIQNMSWIESISGATKEQIEALGGGDLLKQEAGGYSTDRF